MSKYPEHAKLKALAGKNDVVAEFLEFLEGHGYVICDTINSVENRGTGRVYYERTPRTMKSIAQWLAEHFRIDQKKLAAEKDAMYAELVQNRKEG